MPAVSKGAVDVFWPLADSLVLLVTPVVLLKLEGELPVGARMSLSRGEGKLVKTLAEKVSLLTRVLLAALSFPNNKSSSFQGERVWISYVIVAILPRLKQHPNARPRKGFGTQSCKEDPSKKY